MVHYQKDLTTVFKQNMRGGNGTVEAVNLFSKEELEGHARVCDVFSFDPGDSIGTHEHVNEGELYYILCGTALVVENEQEYILHAGDCHYCPSGNHHSIANHGEDVMKMLAVVFTG